MQFNYFKEVIFHLCKPQVDGELKLVAKERSMVWNSLPPAKKLEIGICDKDNVDQLEK